MLLWKTVSASSIVDVLGTIKSTSTLFSSILDPNIILLACSIHPMRKLVGLIQSEFVFRSHVVVA